MSQKIAVFEVAFDPDMMISEDDLQSEYNGDWLRLMQWLYGNEGMGIFEDIPVLVAVKESEGVRMSHDHTQDEVQQALGVTMQFFEENAKANVAMTQNQNKTTGGEDEAITLALALQAHNTRQRAEYIEDWLRHRDAKRDQLIEARARLDERVNHHRIHDDDCSFYYQNRCDCENGRRVAQLEAKIEELEGEGDII